MSPAPVAFSRESFRHCPAAGLPIAAAARCRPEFPPSTRTRPPLHSGQLANPRMQEGRRNVAVVRRYHSGACFAGSPYHFAGSPYHMEKCRPHRHFSGPGHGIIDAPQDEVFRCPAARRVRINFLQPHTAKVLTACRLTAYISLSRCAVRLGVTARLRRSFTDTRFLRGPGVRFRSEARNFDLSRLREAGPSGPGLFDK